MVVLDTNVLLYALDRSTDEHERCIGLVERLRKDVAPWYITWAIVYEFLRVSTHPRVLRKPLPIRTAWEFVEGLFASPSLQILVQGDRHREVAARTLEEVPGIRGNLTHDAHTAILMREHGLRRIYTRDKAFHHFPFLDVLDPLSETS